MVWPKNPTLPRLRRPFPFPFPHPVSLLAWAVGPAKESEAEQAELSIEPR